MPIERIAIFGTGLIGASVGLALRSHGFTGTITGWDPNQQQLHTALSRGAITVLADEPDVAAANSDVILLAGPVFTILESLDRLAPMLRPGQLVTDVGSVKGAICAHARDKFNGPGQPGFLPGHPMAGKEVSGAANADADLFNGSVWLFTELPSRPEGTRKSLAEQPAALSSRPEGTRAPAADRPAALSSRPEAARAPAAERPAALPSRPEGAAAPAAEGPAFPASPTSSPTSALAHEWRSWVAKFGARIVDLSPDRHDILCAWVSHLPQFVSTALSALLQDEFAANSDLLPIGGRALREMTRLGASPFSMWRDIAHTNSEAIAHSLHALEQRLAHLRENLKTPELRDEFERANQFRPNGPTS